MAQHLSKETWTAIDGKTGLTHIETSMDSENAGRHVCSIPKKGNEKVIALIAAAPELLDLAYQIQEGELSMEQLIERANAIIATTLVH